MAESTTHLGPTGVYDFWDLRAVLLPPAHEDDVRNFYDRGFHEGLA